jgi:hypothetical protein
MKSQALADFVAEWIEIQQPTPDAILDHWKMYFDGSLKLGGAGASILFRYYGKPRRIKQSTKHSSMGFG